MMADLIAIAWAYPALLAIACCLRPKDIIKLSRTCKSLNKAVVNGLESLLTAAVTTVHMAMARKTPSHLRIAMLQRMNTRQAVQMIYEMCRLGDLDVMKWISEKHDLGIMWVAAGYPLACRNGHIKVLEWLEAEYPPAEGSMISHINGFMAAVREGQLEVMKWMIARSKIVSKDLVAYPWSCIYVACQYGNLGGVKLLVRHFDLSRETEGIDYIKDFQIACDKGHLEIAQFLVKHFEMTTKEVSSNNHGAFRLACKGNHFATAKWLATRYGAVDEELATGLLHYTCKHGYINVARWLASYHRLPRELTPEIEKIFFEACKLGYLEMAKWLASRYNFPRRPQPKARAAWWTADRNSDYDMVDWLEYYFNLQASSPRSVVRRVRTNPIAPTALVGVLYTTEEESLHTKLSKRP